MTRRHDGDPSAGPECDRQAGCALQQPTTMPSRISCTLHLQGALTESASAACLDIESAVFERMIESDVCALHGVLGASSTIELARKLYRIAVASADPGHMLTRMLSAPRPEVATFCLELAAYRRFMARMEAGNETPRAIANQIEREDREWLLALLHERFGGPPMHALSKLILATDRWTQPADELLGELIRVSIEIADRHEIGEISQQSIDRAMEYLHDFRDSKTANGDEMVNETVDDEVTGRIAAAGNENAPEEPNKSTSGSRGP